MIVGETLTRSALMLARSGEIDRLQKLHLERTRRNNQMEGSGEWLITEKTEGALISLAPGNAEAKSVRLNSFVFARGYWPHGVLIGRERGSE